MDQDTGKQHLTDLFNLTYDRDGVILIAYYIMGWTHAEIGRDLRICRERVRQIRMRAIKKLSIPKEILKRHDSWHLFRYHRRHSKKGDERR